ncbi:stage III sporulation protein AA [Anaerofustis stercorihominis]|uniref:Stage III sporulation protein AA n=1 Tax=Anaerofustis stercorihominis TaxID=214853 RepID=A0A3E3E2M6_9FIRM|nr:stage III sporulation protein AA [Anaerofustis stercorihominis]RGD75168.1 stage III sporulation protein AA [Anaerofustis stercorihominis]
MDTNKLPKEIIDILPDEILKVIDEVNINDEIEEIRLRLNKNIHIVGSKEDILIPYDVKKEDIEGILNLATNYSFYANEDSLLKGFITIKGGHRIGFSGSVIMEDNKVIGLRNINSLNIRISRQIIGASNLVLNYILNKGEVYNTLIISPPKVGKTTLLRDISRVISTNKGDFVGKRVCIVDERKEIASIHDGVNELNIGDKTDVLEGINKSDGMNMLVRAMSPEVIITDEIGKIDDISALENSVLSGVKVISSAHGKDMKDILRKDNFVSIIKKKIFNRYIFLSIEHGERYIKEIYNEKLERLM